MKAVEVLGGPHDGMVYQVPDDASAISMLLDPPELRAGIIGIDTAPIDVASELDLPIVTLMTVDRQLKLVAAWPLYTWRTRKHT